MSWSPLVWRPLCGGAAPLELIVYTIDLNEDKIKYISVVPSNIPTIFFTLKI
jgi:hypothetical protein